MNRFTCKASAPVFADLERQFACAKARSLRRIDRKLGHEAREPILIEGLPSGFATQDVLHVLEPPLMRRDLRPPPGRWHLTEPDARATKPTPEPYASDS